MHLSAVLGAPGLHQCLLMTDFKALSGRIGAGWLEIRAVALLHQVTQPLPSVTVCHHPCLPRGEPPAAPRRRRTPPRRPVPTRTGPR